MLSEKVIARAKQSRQKALHLHDAIAGNTLDAEKKEAFALLTTALEHHFAFSTLVLHGCTISAAAILRPQMEATARGAWLGYCCETTPKAIVPKRVWSDLDRLRKSKECIDLLFQVRDAIDSEILNGLTHGGIEEVSSLQLDEASLGGAMHDETALHMLQFSDLFALAGLGALIDLAGLDQHIPLKEDWMQLLVLSGDEIKKLK